MTAAQMNDPASIMVQVWAKRSLTDPKRKAVVERQSGASHPGVWRDFLRDFGPPWKRAVVVRAKSSARNSLRNLSHR